MKKIAIILSSIMIIGLTVGMVLQQEAISSLPEQTNDEILAAEIQEAAEQQQQEEPVPPVTDQKVDYSIMNEELLVTFDQGENWITVPITPESLFAGEHIGSEQELINNSYVLEHDRTTFLYAVNQGSGLTIQTLSTKDQGKSWQESYVTEGLPSIRFRKMDLLNETFGYAIFSGERTMSSEAGYVYLTNDGGESWMNVGTPDSLRMISDGGFINETIGFMSYGTINPDAPDLYVTTDAGVSWTSSVIHVPEEYKEIFVSAEMPFMRDDQLIIHINQGPNGDYLGGLVKGEFQSNDGGLTWTFVEEVEPDEPSS